MYMSFLEKLKKKPIPKKKEDFVINVPKPQTVSKVKLKTAIVDKRSGKIDRAALLKKINKEESEIDQVPLKPTKKKKLKRIEPTSKPPELPVKSGSEHPQGVLGPKKKKKLRLTREPIVGIKKGTISTLKPPTGATQGRKTTKPKLNVIFEASAKSMVLGDVVPPETLPEEGKKVLIKASSYYLNNRQTFIQSINTLFEPYRADIIKETEESLATEGDDLIIEKCNKKSTDKFELLTHQKIVRDYLNLFTPYRGLLLYHGLGSGKTCSSIAIAEGMKHHKKIIVMTPASLRRNYIEELKHCGDIYYKKSQYWEFIQSKGDVNKIEELSNILHISQDYIRKNNGAWMVNIKKKTNYNSLSRSDKENLDEQLNEMIRNKYQFINYNGLRMSHLDKLTGSGSTNPFDNSVVIIDEAHNFISRIVNKIKNKEALSVKLYEYLMAATQCRIVLLTGTPIINYPNEVGILFNILRGYIKMFEIPLTITSSDIINEKKLKELLNNSAIKYLFDFVEYRPSTKILKLTRNPFGFINAKEGKIYKGVKLSTNGDVTDEELIELLSVSFKKVNIEVLKQGITVNRFKALPDKLEEFQEYFIKVGRGDLKNKLLFQKRILGLTSYFRSAQEQLMPRYDPLSDLHVVKIEMSDYQFGEYEEARVQERKQEKKQKKPKKGKDGIYDDSVSTYRIFSRLFCNYVFPKKLVTRPMPREGENIANILANADEDILDGSDVKTRLNNVDGRYLADDEDKLKLEEQKKIDTSYEQRLNNALRLLKENSSTYLSKEALDIYSRKYLHILENIQDEDNVGLSLIYSQFRTLEGIGIFTLVLEENGFAEFKLIKSSEGGWDIDIKPEDIDKPKYALYTGKEDSEAKEIIRNIYNSTWEYVPINIVEKLKVISGNNNLGEIIKVFMITASGAEGITLRNCRFVHIMEPYWHPVRIEQVIGRAKRICSHKDLPSELRNVKVFLYLMTFSDEQIARESSIELKLKDVSKTDKSTPLTSDEALYEISNIKSEINKKLLTAVKESAFDCSLHTTSYSKEPLVCFSFANPNPNKFSFTPSLSGEEKDDVAKINTKKITWKAKTLKYLGVNYAFRKETGEVYDLDSYMQALKEPGINPILIGKLIKDPVTNKYKLEKI